MAQKRKAPVTIVIGMKCQNGIIVVCDSRTTQPSGHIRDDAQKLSVIAFTDGQSAIIAEAGHADFSSRAVEIISSLAKSRPMDDYRALAACAEQGVAELKDQIRKQYRGTSEELQKHFGAYEFELMMAHYCKGIPYIFTLDFPSGIAVQKKSLHNSIGCGWILADFLLTPLNIAGFTTTHGVCTSVYAVEEIKKFDSRCGGPVRVGVINFKDGKSVAQLSSESAVKQATDTAQMLSESETTKWKQTVENLIRDYMENDFQIKKP